MEIVTFYSFKGGVGRTQLLLNSACELAMRGKNVIMLDMDLHAPGLSLMPCLSRGKLRAAGGLIDFFESMVDLQRSENKEGKVVDLLSCAYQPPILKDKLEKRGKDVAGELWLLPCGFFSEEGDEQEEADARAAYMKKLNLLAPDFTDLARRSKSYAQQEEGHDNPILGEIQSQLARIDCPSGSKKIDYLFIDARTGFTEISDLLFVHGSNRLVLVSGLNRQNLAGLKIVLEELTRVATPGWQRRLSVVMSPVPWGEDAMVLKAKEEIRDLLAEQASFKETSELFGGAEMPRITTIPYHPRLAVDESPIVLEYSGTPITDTYSLFAGEISRETKGEAILRRLAAIGPSDSPESGEVGTISPPQQHSYLFGNRCRWDEFVLPEHRDSARERLYPSAAWRGDEHAYRDAFLNALWHSLSLSSNEKERVVRSLPSLSPFQISALEDVFRDERNEFETLALNETPVVAGLLGKNWAEWTTMLRKVGIADSNLRSLSEVVERIDPPPGPFGHPQFWFAFADILYESGDTQWMEMLVHGRENFPADIDFFKAGLRLLGRAGKHDEEMQWLEQGVKIDGLPAVEEGHLRNALGDHYISAGRLGDAEKSYREALALGEGPDFAFPQVGAWLGLGNVLFLRDSLDEARTQCDNALRICRESKWELGELYVCNLLGWISWGRKELPEAKDWFERVSIQAGQVADDSERNEKANRRILIAGKRGLGWVFLHDGKPEEARKLFMACLKSDQEAKASSA